MDDAETYEKIFAGEPRAVARAISAVENGAENAADLMKAVFPKTGNALIIGITGSPGAGKSSLVDKLALFYKERGERIGIVCVDPSSPFSGGAILGDRIRMAALGTDRNVFIRSMATRGNLGGLSRATVDAVAILDAAGFDKIIVEIKAVSNLIDEHRGQTINCLHATKFELALLVNFGHYPKLEYERFLNIREHGINDEMKSWLR